METNSSINVLFFEDSADDCSDNHEVRDDIDTDMIREKKLIFTLSFINASFSIERTSSVIRREFSASRQKELTLRCNQ